MELKSEEALLAAARALTTALRDPLVAGQLPLSTIDALRRLELVIQAFASARGVRS